MSRCQLSLANLHKMKPNKFNNINEVLHRITYYDKKGEMKQIVVPSTNRVEILNIAHNTIMSGHMGYKKTYN